MSDGIARDVAELEAIVPVMRRLGVAQAFGVVLGPEPTKVETLARAVEEKPTPELEAELRKAKRQAEIEELRDLLSANGHEYTDEQLERLLPPEGT